MSVKDRIMVITDLLLGAVYADDNLEGSEEEAVRKLLIELLDGDDLPEEVDARIKTFPAGSFDLAATAADFAADPPVAKRKLMELVAAVHDADEQIDLAEDDYLNELGEALGLSVDEYADLSLDYEIEDLRDNLKSLTVSTPPPIPES